MKYWFSLLLSVLLSCHVLASDIDWNQPLPVDSNLRHGVLSNGFTYYVYPQPGFGSIDMKLVTRIGSIVENDDERGLAHFLEHMTFEGTKNYPGDLASRLLQGYGLHMGEDVNATTGFNDTQFDIKNISASDTTEFLYALSIIHDWSCNLTLTDSAITKQKGIVREEWRTGSDFGERMATQMCKTLLKGSQYEDRTPIGSMEVIQNLNQAKLQDFYHKWYRPDLQALMVVGDCDADVTVELIKELFDTIPARQNPQPRLDYPIPYHKGIQYCNFVDPEASSTLVGVFFQHDKTPRERLLTKGHIKDLAIQYLATAMLNMRFDDVSLSAESPFTGAECVDQEFLVATTADAFELMAEAKQGKSLEAYTSLLTEARRAMVHGFSPSELERAKAYFNGLIDNQLEEKDRQHRKDYIQSFIDNYINGGDLCSFEESYEMLREIIEEHCTTDDVNQYMARIIKPDNVGVLIAGPNNEQLSYPDEQTVVATFHEVFNSVPDVYTDTISNAPILRERPTPGTITSCETADSIIYSLTLSNGAKVLLMPTSCKNDEILFSGVSDGGFIAFNNQHSTALRAMNDVIEYSALGGIPYNELKKRLVNTNLSLVFQESPYHDEFSGNTGKKDLEALFQILYLYFTDIRKDEQTFEAYRSSKISEYRQSSTNPEQVFSDSIIATVYPTFPYAQRLTEEELNSLDYDEILTLYRERVANPGDYTFTVVGNFTIDGILPLIETYIASIPDNGKREHNPIKSIVRRGTYLNSFTKPMLTPKTSVEIELYAPCSFSVKNKLHADMLTYIFDYLINNEIREKKNSSYGAQVLCELEENSNQLEFKCQFDTNNDDADEVYRICREVIANTLRDGVSFEVFCDIYNQQIKIINFALNNNSFWQYHLHMMKYGCQYAQEYIDALNDMTHESLNRFIQSLSPVSDLTTIMKGE